MITRLLQGDVGFRVFKLASSNIRAWEPDAADLENSLLKNAEHLVQGRKEQDVLYELLLKLGLDLCVPIETKTIAGKTVHSIGGGALIVCLADGSDQGRDRAVERRASSRGGRRSRPPSIPASCSRIPASPTISPKPTWRRS